MVKGDPRSAVVLEFQIEPLANIFNGVVLIQCDVEQYSLIHDYLASLFIETRLAHPLYGVNPFRHLYMVSNLY